MRTWLKALVLFLDEALFAVLVLLILWALDVRLSPGIIAAVVVLLGASLALIYWGLKSTVRRRHLTGREGMIGLQGKVVKALSPIGVVKIEGELWNASSAGGTVGVDEDVVVVDVEGLRLTVRRKE